MKIERHPGQVGTFKSMPNEFLEADVCSVTIDVHTPITGLVYYLRKLKNVIIFCQVLSSLFFHD